MNALQWNKDKLKEACEHIDYHKRELEHWQAEKIYYERNILAIEAAQHSVQTDGEEPVRLNFTITDDDVKRTEELFPHLRRR